MVQRERLSYLAAERGDDPVPMTAFSQRVEWSADV